MRWWLHGDPDPLHRRPEYPPDLAGPKYPDGFQIHDESELAELIAELDVDDVVFAYSDVSDEYVIA